MPRESVLGQLNPQTLTPFARLVYDYLVNFKPSRDVTWLSRQSGIAANTIAAWLKYGVNPKRQKVVQLAERVPDIATLDELLAAAGLPSTATVQRERLAHAEMLRASLSELLALVDADPAFGEEERAIIHRAMERKVAEFVTQTDTWREYGHVSPALHEAQRGAAQARMLRPTQPPAPHDDVRDDERDNRPSGPYHRVTDA